MAAIKFYGNDKATRYKCSPILELVSWIKGATVLGVDTETNVVDSILDRELKVISISSNNSTDIWVVEWDYLTREYQKGLLNAMSSKLCIMHNVAFDLAILTKYGAKMDKVYDTMLAEKILNNGLSVEKGFHGLQAIYQRRFNLNISKASQTSFGEGGPYTDEQIEYAAIDVLKLVELREFQLKEAKAVDKSIGLSGNKGLVKTIWWDNEFIKVITDLEMRGINIDKETWYKGINEIKPIYFKELSALNQIVIKEYYEVLVDNDWIFEEDTFPKNVWTSTAKKKIILGEIYGLEFDKTSAVELKKFLQKHDPSFPEGLAITGKAWNNSDYRKTFTDKFAVVKLLIGKTPTNADQVHSLLDKLLIENLRDFCILKEYLIPAGKLTLNWGSPSQRLKIFQAIDPGITSTAKDVLVDYESDNKIITHYLGWASVDHTLKSFGEGFYENNVEKDGKFRTRFNTILKTGRLSSVKPNLLNIPSTESCRSSIVPDEGWDLIDADYDGQELIVVTELSQEPSWKEYMEKGYDMHSKNAALIFGQEWEDAAEEDCAYYKDNKFLKCNCPKHKEMRNASKAVSFGSIYGISHIKLAFNLKISEERAKFILQRFFEIVPEVRNMMDKFGNYATTNGHIVEPVFGRVRFFDKWKLAVPAEHGAIQRAAFNTPIQSSGSAVLKIAFVLLQRWIKQRGLENDVQLLLPYHDEVIAQSKPEYTQEAKQAVEHYMMLAANLAGFDIKAGAEHGASWLAAH